MNYNKKLKNKLGTIKEFLKNLITYLSDIISIHNILQK